MTRSGNAISYHDLYWLRRSQIRAHWHNGSCAHSLCACVCGHASVQLTFPKPQQIRAEQVPIDWLVENRDLWAAVHRLHTLLRWMLYRYRGLQKLVLADEEKQKFCDLWIDFLRLMWKMSHKPNIKVIIFLQGLTSNLCWVACPRRADTYTLQCHYSVTVQLQRVMFCCPPNASKVQDYGFVEHSYENIIQWVF